MARAAWYFPVTSESAPPEQLRGLFRTLRETQGFVPNVFRVYAYRPKRLSAWFAHLKLLHEPTPGLDSADRELIAVVVSAWNRCTSCVIVHGQALRSALGGSAKDAVLADYVATNWRHAGLDRRRSAICAFAEKLTATAHLMSEHDLVELEAVGLSKAEVWDVIEITAMYNFTNRLALATGQQPNEQYHTIDRPQQ